MRHCTCVCTENAPLYFSFFASKAEDRAIGLGASAQGRCVAASRPANASHVFLLCRGDRDQRSQSGAYEVARTCLYAQTRTQEHRPNF